MEYWNGNTLTYPITQVYISFVWKPYIVNNILIFYILIIVVVSQEAISSFRYKLASILLCWKTNTAAMTTTVEQRDYDTDGDPNHVEMLESLDDRKKSKAPNSLSVQYKYQSLISVLSNLSLHELVGGLCRYIKSINSTETLE